MKPGLCRNCHEACRIFRIVLILAAYMLAGCVIASQVYMAVCREGVGANPAGAEAASGYVELHTRRHLPGEAFILVNGRRYAQVTSGTVRVGVADNAVVELYNGTGGVINVEITGSSSDAEILSEVRNIECGGGITHICRCVGIR